MINLNNADSQGLAALSRLKEQGNEALLRLIGLEVEAATQLLIKATDMATVHRLQGRVGAFTDLFEAADEARTMVTRARNAPKQYLGTP